MKVVIDQLNKSYGDQKAVDDLSFSVDTGEVVGFLGPNGAGKSTTMKMITNYLEADSGSINIGPYSMESDADEIRKHMGYLPENNPLYTDMPVLEYLRFCAELQDVDRSIVNSRIREMVGLCGINKEKHKKIGELSKGYKQRVGLAQAMIHDPEILILDEPTTGLDPNQIVEIRRLIRELGQHKTVILSTHILPEVEATCDRILIISKGKIVANGTAGDLRRQSSGNTIYQVKFSVSEAEAGRQLNSLPGVTATASESHPGLLEVEVLPELDFPKQVFELCRSNNWHIMQLTPVETSLEDIFRGLTLS